MRNCDLSSKVNAKGERVTPGSELFHIHGKEERKSVSIETGETLFTQCHGSG